MQGVRQQQKGGVYERAGGTKHTLGRTSHKRAIHGANKVGRGNPSNSRKERWKGEPNPSLGEQFAAHAAAAAAAVAAICEIPTIGQRLPGLETEESHGGSHV